MDKLKEVQKYQFWILLTVALILPLVGWQMAVSGLAKEADERTKGLETLNKSIATTPSDPNQEWKKGIEVINGEQSKQKLLAWRYLWDRQAPLMVWPEKMPSDPDKITPSQQEYWRTAYRKFVTQVRLKVNPYDEDNNPNGLVEYPEDLLPKPDDEWIQAPSVKQIVASQEDLWLLESLLTAIASVNAGAPSIYDAPIRQIDQLYLRGGTAQKGGGGATKAATGATGGAGAGHGGMPMPPVGMFGGGNRDTGVGGAGVGITSASINADDDLGAERAAAAEKAAGGGTAAATGTKGGHGGATTMPMPTAMATAGMGAGGFGGGKGGWSGFDKDRYRDDKPEWKTRGFHLEVVMHHRRVPELLTALSNATWPITVLRIQMSDYRDEDLADVGGGTSGGMAGGMPGMSGGRGGQMPGMMRMPGMGSGGRGGNAPPARTRGGEDGGGDLLSNRSVLDDPNLAHVAIVGLIYIVKKPPEDKTPPAAPPAPASSPAAPAVVAPGTAPATAPAATADGAPAATAEAAEPTADAEKPADESASDDAEKPAEDAQSPTDSKKEPEVDSKKPEPAPSEPGKT